MCCTSKIKLLRSRMNTKKFLLNCRRTVYCFTTVFAEKLLVTQFRKVCDYVFHKTFSASNVFQALTLRCCDIFKREYYSSTVHQSLVITKLNAPLQCEQISHSYNINAKYLPHSDCSRLSLVVNFKILYQ